MRPCGLPTYMLVPEARTVVEIPVREDAHGKPLLIVQVYAGTYIDEDGVRWERGEIATARDWRPAFNAWGDCVSDVVKNEKLMAEIDQRFALAKAGA